MGISGVRVRVRARVRVRVKERERALKKGNMDDLNVLNILNIFYHHSRLILSIHLLMFLVKDLEYRARALSLSLSLFFWRGEHKYLPFNIHTIYHTETSSP